MVNTERDGLCPIFPLNYNILNIVVNTELKQTLIMQLSYYNILNIVVNTEQGAAIIDLVHHYNILNIVVNTEHRG